MTGSDLQQPHFSIVTPSYNMLGYLKRCHRSIADQGELLEHIVFDAGSRDGTPEWLTSQRDIRSVVEPDRGMYDAVNKGFRRARGRFISYLNCDEQYLPGTLRAVRDYFDRHPRVDIVFGDALLVNPDGSLIAFRKGYAPRWPYIAASHLYVLSCTMFLRRRIVEDGFEFDSSWRDIADAQFVIRLLRSRYRAAHVPRYLSAFTMTGSNMSAGPNARREEERAWAQTPRWIRGLRLPLNVIRLAEKTITGAYRQRLPLSYSLYTSDRADTRTVVTAQVASFRWPKAS